MGERYICGRGCVLLCQETPLLGTLCPDHRDHWHLAGLTNEGDAIRQLRKHFRDNDSTRHRTDCICPCCNAVEVLAARFDQERGR